ASARVPHADKEQMLEKVLRGKVVGQLLDFLKVVSRHGRMDCLRAINEAAHRLNDERRGRVLVTVVTASPIDDQLLSQINSQLSAALGKQAILQTRVNPELLGGLEVRIGDKVYDGSLRTRLEKMRGDALNQAIERMRRNPDRLVKNS
ncbi:MAG TPA: ATP synthase F1 subunit delta, partial [Pirellulaceae bacterium]|nr:ATP synthase F1 subunit delta [Pirellulaceae bacterium]